MTIKTVLVSLTLFFSGFIFSQSPNYEAALKSFQENYNNNNPEPIFNMFDATMQASVNLNTTTDIVTTFQTNYGNFKSFHFKERKETLETYTGVFENGKLTILLSLNSENKINGLLFKPYEDDGSPGKFDRNTTTMQLPFKGDWFTFWGGTDKRDNYHVINRAQRGAFDFVIVDSNNKTYERSGTRNEDYYAFGKPLYAVCDAEVVQVITGIEDNKPGTMNPKQALGNSLTLKTSNNEYVVYAHFEKGTIKVKKGDRVVKGQLLGNCGNSGNSSEPHLHIHLQDDKDMANATGARLFFEELLVNGELQNDYSPVKNDVISRTKQ
ncbi:peptidoglycan DD-metalloendopeptidase family protein [Patiriisocius hiemis]|uniref:Peptidoglycan DD-metalloendopeptidase family protein n=1 Tax=Patiriisocius hiemis TaxID=3075604 RepID=A0ABU2Y8Q0_9FLAO|nr:peptidoglycan DD-metalloendopeptidase family protein [Constantimarinum sp. W242]MDT0554556.1 peptidoglycan DD-metalloendopeptidase family protein [Constantimarinum sp. W242]